MTRIQFARALARLVLKHARLSQHDRAYVQQVADAETVEQMYAASAYAASAYPYTPYDAYAFYAASISAAYAVSAPDYAAYAASVSAPNYTSIYWLVEACQYAIESGVPADELNALRCLITA